MSKITKQINLNQIEIDRLPLNSTGLDTTHALINGIEMPPIKIQNLGKGRFRIKDGRHRYLAHMLTNQKTILAKFSTRVAHDPNQTST
tara:strand:+ start:949 stop:1212 length:264 start_codon:yes stop_codon:yes gene_type:complete